MPILVYKLEERIEVKFHADIDNNFVKKAIEHIGFKIKFDENKSTVFGRKSFSYSDIEKLCCMERDILEVKGITRLFSVRAEWRNIYKFHGLSNKFLICAFSPSGTYHCLINSQKIFSYNFRISLKAPHR